MFSHGKIKLQRRIAEAVSHRINYDYLCYRGSVMNESYLRAIVSEIIVACVDQHKYRVRCEFPHPAFNTNKAGRKQEVDYAIENLINNTNDFIIEAKWAGSSHCKASNVLRDLVRLKAVKDWSGNSCSVFFMLAGSVKDIRKLFSKDIFKHGNGSPLFLETQRASVFNLGAGTKQSNMVDKIAKEFVSYNSIKFPAELKCKLACDGLVSGNKMRFAAVVWEVF